MQSTDGIGTAINGIGVPTNRIGAPTSSLPNTSFAPDNSRPADKSIPRHERQPFNVVGMKVTAVLSDFRPSCPRAGVSAALPAPLDAARQHVEKYPELNYLADPAVSATNEGAGSPISTSGLSAALGKSRHFPEFERSLVSLRCLNQIIDGSAESYDEWVSAQKPPKLSYASFTCLADRWSALTKHFASKGIHPNELKTAAEVALVLGDMGKADAVRVMMADLDIRDPDHDDFYGHVMNEPRALQRLASFQSMRPEMQALLRGTANLAHFGHITHCEGGPQMFAKLKAANILNTDPWAFEFAALVHICDVAGALGHRNTQGSIVYNQATFDAIEAAFDACRMLEKVNETDAYESLLRTRARVLGLSPDSQEDRMLARLGAMMRLATPEQGKALKQGFSKLAPADQTDALHHLGISAAGNLPCTATYMPALLVNLMNNTSLASSHEKRLSHAIEIGVPFIVSTLKTYQQMLSTGAMSPDIPLNFNPVAGTAAVDPEQLLSRMPAIDRHSGKVTT